MKYNLFLGEYEIVEKFEETFQKYARGECENVSEKVHYLTIQHSDSNQNLILPNDLNGTLPYLQKLIVKNPNHLITKDVQWPENLTHLHIYGSLQDDLPEIKFSHISCLKTSHCSNLRNISKIKHITKLKRLILEETPNLTISANTFQSNGNITELALKHCNDLKLENGSFIGLDELVELNFTKNGLTNMPTRILQSLKSLKHFNWEERSQILKIPKYFFNSNLNLKKFLLNGNFKIDGSAFQAEQFRKIEEIEIVNGNIDSDIFHGFLYLFKNLKSLNLNGNRLSTIGKNVTIMLKESTATRRQKLVPKFHLNDTFM